MKMNKFKNQKWYPNTVAICVGVILYVALTHLDVIWGVISTIGDYIYPLVAGAILAYLINPLMKWYSDFVLGKLNRVLPKKILSEVLAFGTVIVFLLFLGNTLVPQLITSIKSFYGNLDGYLRTLNEWIDELGSSAITKNLQGLLSSSQDLVTTITTQLTRNRGQVISVFSSVGGHVSAWVIGIIFSVYFLNEKDLLKNGLSNIMRIIMKEEQYHFVVSHLKKMDEILSRYIIFSVIDGLIVGIINAIFMAIMGMPYVGLVSVVAGVTNLIPTFGPIIGAVINSFILLLANPRIVLYFLIFTLILQTIDGYILKPKMFGETFGVSGLWILAAIIVGGRIFGVIGILLAIPIVAIVDYLMRDCLLPWLEKRKKREVSLEAEGEKVSSSGKEG